MSSPVVAVVGATGAVGVEFLACLEQRKFPMKELRLLASARSAGKTMTFKGADDYSRRADGIQLQRRRYRPLLRRRQHLQKVRPNRRPGRRRRRR